MMRSLTYARRNPYYLMLAMALGGSGIMFLFITLAFVSRWDQSGYQAFSLPGAFWLSTLALTLSSGALWQANFYFRHEKYRRYKTWLGLTLLLGLGFAAFQVWGWLSLYQAGVVFSTSIGGSFVYLLSGLHAAHILLGILGLAYLYGNASRNRNYVEGFIDSLNPVKTSWLKLVTWYWHFVDGIWLFLFLVMLARH